MSLGTEKILKTTFLHFLKEELLSAKMTHEACNFIIFQRQKIEWNRCKLLHLHFSKFVQNPLILANDNFIQNISIAYLTPIFDSKSALRLQSVLTELTLDRFVEIEMDVGDLPVKKTHYFDLTME